MAKPLLNRWIGLVFVSMAISLVIIDGTIVNTIFPSVIKTLNLDSTEVQWVQESYVLVFAALLLVWGSIADRIGRKRLLLIGIAIFVAASIWAGFSQDASAMILARIVQGFGGSMVLPTTLSLVNASFQGKERGIAFAIWGSAIGGMVAVGPLLGGWLTTDYSWRWAFGINIPIGIIIIIGALLTVPESKEDGNTGRIDWMGAVYSVIAMSTLVFGLIEGRTYGWWEVNKPFTVGDWTWPGKVSIIPVMFLVFVLATTLFITHGAARLKKGKPALLSFNLFGIASFRNGNIAAMVIALGEFGIILSLPLWLQFVIGYDALQTGFVLLGLAGGAFVASGLAGGLSGKVSPVSMVRLGILLEIVGVAGVGFAISPTATWINVVPWLFVYGMGVGLATAQLTNVVLKDVPVQESGQASGTQSTARQLGSALGIAVLGTILFTSVQVELTQKLTDEKLPAAQVTQVVDSVVDSAGGAIIGLEQNPETQPIATAAKVAISDGTRYGAFAAAGFLGLGFLATLSLGATRKVEVEKIHEGGDAHVI